MKKRLLSLITSVLVLSSATALPPVQAADNTAEDPLFGVLPEWVPQDFASAMQFSNTYGKSHIEDGIICLVRPMYQWQEESCDISISGSMTMVNTPAGSQPKIYELEIPEKPDPSDEEAVEAYEEYCDSLGIYSHDYSFFESYAGCRTQYAYEVELFQVLDGLDLNVAWIQKTGDEWLTTEKFSFENKDGTIAETDIYSWLPDSLPEFNNYRNQYGTASVHDNYVVYCADVNGSTGASLKMTQSGDGAIEEVMDSECTPFMLLPDDGSSEFSVILYHPTADGMTDVKWTIGQEWDPQAPKEETSGLYEIKDNCSVIIDHSAEKRPVTVFTFVDADTGELIDVPEDGNWYLLKCTTGDQPQTSEIFDVTSNPCTVDSIAAYSPLCSYSFHCNSSSGWYEAPEFEITLETEVRREITCKLTWTPSGDTNGDDTFNLSDAVFLQKWLLGSPDASSLDWKTADLCRDNKINVFDLIKMKQKVIDYNRKLCVEPEISVEFGTSFYTISDDLKLYTGPDEIYSVVMPVPRYTYLRELGYQKDNDQWLFTEYDGLYGWLRVVEKDGKTPTIEYNTVTKKPAIYLYPEEETDVHVELELIGSELSTTYPKYNNGWDVVASPDGTLLNKADGTHHRYLFWDSTNVRTRYDFSKGFCVAGVDTESFLREKLTYMGLNEEEMNEFIVYWLPLMEHTPYNLIAFQGNAYTDTAKLDITPAPDSMLRVFMTYVPLDEEVEIQPQQLETFERKGFTVVEWGGSEIG